MRHFAAALAACILVAGPAAEAVPYDAVVPEIVEIDTTGVPFLILTGWGWIAPTGGTLTAADFTAAQFTANFSDPNVAISFLGFPAPLDLDVGEVGGNRLDSPVLDNTAFDPLLLPSETLVNPSMPFGLSLTLTPGYTGTGTLNASLTLDGHTASYSTEVRLVNGGPRMLVVDGQRVSAVPEPATFAMAVLGLVGLGLAGRRRARAGATSAR